MAAYFFARNTELPSLVAKAASSVTGADRPRFPTGVPSDQAAQDRTPLTPDPDPAILARRSPDDVASSELPASRLLDAAGSGRGPAILALTHRG